MDGRHEISEHAKNAPVPNRPPQHPRGTGGFAVMAIRVIAVRPPCGLMKPRGGGGRIYQQFFDRKRRKVLHM